MKPESMVEHENPDELLTSILERIHTEGPIHPEDVETLAYLKHYHSEIFSRYEKRITYLLGLFFKVGEPDDIVSLAYSAFKDAIEETTHETLTPVQASIRTGILEHKYYTFSTPTSAGKSYLFRSLIKNETRDIVIIVPSRALIAEYLFVVREILHDDNSVLILQFIDDINKFATSRRVFIVTPERGKDLFQALEKYDISLFLFDEAQLADEKWRGVNFDAFVRRADRTYPDAKKVFAHPFIVNPEAQFSKHGFTDNIAFNAYKHRAVGKIFLGYYGDNNPFSCFSPYIERAHWKNNQYMLSYDIVEYLLKDKGTLLVFVSKASIYNKSCLEKFSKYINMCEPIECSSAIEIIERIERLIGAAGQESDLVKLMRNGIVLHHGSIPLPVRYQIELFTKKGFAKICFSTSTLVQGVNMPFDVVWADNIRFHGSKENKALGLNNLIGRAGRTNKDEPDKFDYGYVVVSNIQSFTAQMHTALELSEHSLIDNNPDDIPDDLEEEIEAIKEDSFSDEYNLPTTRIERLTSEKCSEYIAVSLNLLFRNGTLITGSEYRELSEDDRTNIKEAMKGIFAISLNRELQTGEQTVISTAVTILLWHVQGKTFREVVKLRYGYLTRIKEQRELERSLNNGEISEEDFEERIGTLEVRYSAPPYQLPNSSLTSRPQSSFGHSKITDLNFDRVVYDTYDYLDKVVSFSLADVFIAAYGEYSQKENDERAKAMVNYIRYGTNEETEIMLLRYGFSFEDIELVKEHILSIDENRIEFATSVDTLQDETVMELISRYR